MPGLAFKLLTKEPLVVFLPGDHRLASRKTIRPQDIPRETFISVPKTTAPALRAIIDNYAKRTGIDLTPDHEVDNISMAISIIVSTRGLALLPLYARNLLPPSVVSRPLPRQFYISPPRTPRKCFFGCSRIFGVSGSFRDLRSVLAEDWRGPERAVCLL
jgi:DNA-binding transcriptional LysR family regulator